MSFADAVAADQAGDLELAASEYETSLSGESASLRGMVNLAVLYWQATDFGLSTAKGLKPAFVARAGERCSEVLAQARRSFPGSSEVAFWERYIAWADLGEQFSADDCRQLLAEDPTTLVPAMHLFALSGGESYQDEALALRHECQQEGTTRGRYVLSVIEGVMKRAKLAVRTGAAG